MRSAPTNIGTLDLTFNASLTNILGCGSFIQSMKLQYEEEAGPKKTRNVATGSHFSGHVTTSLFLVEI